MSYGGESEGQVVGNMFARPIVAGVATAGLLFVLGGADDIGGFARQVGYGAGAVLVSDYASAMVFGGAGGMLVSPVMTGAVYGAINRAMGSDRSWINLGITGAGIDIASQWLYNPVASMLGL
jgi:hypothetical protein